MKTDVSIIMLPLDPSDPATTTQNFGLSILTEYQFPAGQAYSKNELIELVNNHPILQDYSVDPLTAYIWEYDSWVKNGKKLDSNKSQKVDLFYNDDSRETKLQLLQNYLVGKGLPKSASNIVHDKSLDQLTEDDYVDIARVYDQVHSFVSVVQEGLLSSMASFKSSSMGAGDFSSVQFSLHINTIIQESLLKLIDIGDRKSFHSFSEATQTDSDPDHFFKSISAVEKRFDALSTNRKLARVVSGADNQNIDQKELNTAIKSALKNSLLSSSLGLVTKWNASIAVPLIIGKAYILQINKDAIKTNQHIIDIKGNHPTVFCRSTHTHPIAFEDINGYEEGNSGLAYLTKSSGEHRFRVTTINTEHQLVKQLILQRRNSLADVGSVINTKETLGGVFTRKLDDRPPSLLKREQYGIPEPDTSGAIISAPVDDILIHKNLRFSDIDARNQNFPCYFLDDLIIGYRLDLRNIKDDASNLVSVHREKQEITLNESGMIITGWTEDYFDREQPDDPKYESSSTEITTYIGMSAAQRKDYMAMLGINNTRVKVKDHIFGTKVLDYKDATQLLFHNKYEYRLRNVLSGGVSLSAGELSHLEKYEYSRQIFPFYRARAYRPGELISTTNEIDKHGDDAPKTIILSEENTSHKLFLVPSPIDLEASRYHGLCFSSASDSTELFGRKHVSDLGSHFSDGVPNKLDYFFDPDVAEIEIRAVFLNGDPNSTESEYIITDNRFCRIIRHMEIDPVTARYGKHNAWKNFRPIKLYFKTTKKSIATIRVHGRKVIIRVPKAGQLDISIVPKLTDEQLEKSASKIGSSQQLYRVENLGGFTSKFLSKHYVPAISEVRLKVIHETKIPLQIPDLVCETTQLSNDNSYEINESSGDSCVAIKIGSTEKATFRGYLELDSASTSKSRLIAKWQDINDDPRLDSYNYVEGSTRTKDRDITFNKFDSELPTLSQLSKISLTSPEVDLNSLAPLSLKNTTFGFMNQFTLQCKEDKVFYSTSPRDLYEGEVLDDFAEHEILNFVDKRRKIGNLEAIVTARTSNTNDNQFSNIGYLTSAPVIFDVPSSIELPAPSVAFVLPIASNKFSTEPRKSYRKVYGLRVYVNRPCFTSGAGERIAIGCSSTEMLYGHNGGRLNKFVTQWGEDPVERMNLDVTNKTPRASYFGTLPEYDLNIPEHQLDINLYPKKVKGGRESVIYVDNIRNYKKRGETKIRNLSVASYALRFDKSLKLWYFDILMKERFFGWCGFALYRHQPQSIDGYELSITPDWVYGSFLHEGSVVWHEKKNHIYITVGPVFNQNITYELNNHEYKRGVSKNLTNNDNAVSTLPLKDYIVRDGAKYFEITVPKLKTNWNLVLKRYGIPISSHRIQS